MSNRPLVSIVTSFLNAEQFIGEAIESVLGQTYGHWELLLVDDGSTDGGTDIARHYAETHSERVRYLEHPGHANRYPSASRNLGLVHAWGKYFAFLDADDVWLPQKLAQQVTILDSHPEAAMVYGLSQWWYSWAANQDGGKCDFVHDLGVPSNTLIRPPELIERFFLAQDAAIPSPTDILVRREAVGRVCGFEEGPLAEYEDQAFFAKLCLKEPVFAVNTCWDRYRQHPDSSCAVARMARREYASRLNFLNWLASYLTEQGVKDTEIWRGLQRELRRCQHPAPGWLSTGKQQALRQITGLTISAVRRLLPSHIRNRLWARWKGIDYTPPTGHVRFGSLRRVTPLSREFGYDRGLPIDRYYIERFLSQNARYIHGHVLEIANNTYTRRFGGYSVTKTDVLDVEGANPNATIVADLAAANHLPSDIFDCVILTQTLQFVYDVRAAIQTLHRILKPGGVVMATFSGLSPIDRYSMDRYGHYWGFTTMSACRLFEEAFGESGVHVGAYGNVLSAAAFLYGISAEELTLRELDYIDPDYELVVAVRAVKPAEGG